MDLELTPQERDQILKQREAHEPKLDEQRASLLADLDELNERGRAGAFGPLPRDLDAGTVALVKKIQDIGYRMRTAPHGDAMPFAIPSRVCLEIIKALRGDARPPARPGGFAVPG